MPRPNSARDGYRILIVDDTATVRESLRWLLEDEPGLVVVGEAATGEEALKLADNLNPDLIILDIELPDINGFEVTRQLKAGANPPFIILLSMHYDSIYRKRGMEVGCDDYIGKEMGWNGLLEGLKKILKYS